jgi:hypothetical protein
MTLVENPAGSENHPSLKEKRGAIWSLHPKTQRLITGYMKRY